jgi:hypothetical protein
MTKNRTRFTSVLVAAAALLMVGCASNPISGVNQQGVKEVGNTSSMAGFFNYARNTWGVEKPQQMHLTRVQLKMNLPATIVMQKQAIGEVPIITNTDKREALLTARAQMQVLDQGLRTQFEKKALQYGVTLSDMSADIVHVDVVSIYSFCEAYKGCKTRLNLQVKITDISDKIVWRYEGAIEQTQPKEQVNQPLFDAFSDTLLEAMQQAHIIGARGG